MKCPHQNLDCISDIDTSGMAGDIDRGDCFYYGKTVSQDSGLEVLSKAGSILSLIGAISAGVVYFTTFTRFDMLVLAVMLLVLSGALYIDYRWKKRDRKNNFLSR